MKEELDKCYFCGKKVRFPTAMCFKHWQKVRREHTDLKAEYEKYIDNNFLSDDPNFKYTVTVLP